MKKRTGYRILTCLLCFLVAVSLVGCGATPADSPSASASASTSASASAASSEAAPENPIANQDITFTYFAGLAANLAPTATSLAEAPMYQELEKRTGIKIEFLHPPLGQENEQFNLMIASNELPDMIEWNWLSFPGGPEKAITDGVILQLNDIIDASAPNLKAYYSQYPEHEKQVKTDTGKHYVFPFIRRDERLLTWNGPQVRQDWLDELGIEPPTTIEEWESMLLRFKNEKSADAPFTYADWLLGSSNTFLGAYGVGRSFYQENGQVKFGPVEEGYRQFLELFARWYELGLLDPDFAAQDGAAMDAKITGGRTGAWLQTAGSGMGKYITLMKDDPSFKVLGLTYPTLAKGEEPKFGHKDFNYTPGGSVAITSACEEVEAAAKWLDYAYGEEGHILFNFGIEGESFNWEGDFPKYSDYIMNNPDGLPMVQAMARYMRSNYAGPMIQDGRYFDQYMQYEEQIDGVNNWLKHDDSRRIPPVTPTPEESQEFANIMNEVNTFTNEMFIKFVMGQGELTGFDQYVDQVKSMGIERAIAIQQSALDRYNAR